MVKRLDCYVLKMVKRQIEFISDDVSRKHATAAFFLRVRKYIFDMKITLEMKILAKIS